MDMMTDTQSAIDTFGKHTKGDLDKGHVYLDIFGLLQGLFLQQDAAIHLAESLQFSVDIKEYPQLKEIREIRHDAAGHPTKRGDPPRSWNFLIQHSLSYNNFEILCWRSPTGHTTIPVSTKNIIEDQRRYIGEILEKTLNEIKRRDDEYKTKFKMKKIADVLPDTTGYMCEKIASAVDHRDELNLGEFAVAFLQSSLDKFETELREREIAIDTYPGIQMAFTDLQYPLKKLQEHFSESITLDKEAAHIFVDFISTNLDSLKKMAKELDKEFFE